MWLKLAVAAFLGVGATMIAVIVLANIGVEVDFGPSTSPTAAPCRPLNLAVLVSKGQPMVAVDGHPTTETGFLGDLEKKRGQCAAQSTAIYIRADRTLKFGEFTRFDDALKQAGYRKIYFDQTDHR